MVFTELTINGELPLGFPPATFCLQAPGHNEPIGSVGESSFPAGPFDRPSLLFRLLGNRTPVNVKRSVVLSHGTNSVVMSLQYFPPVFHEVVQVYDAAGQLFGRCISFSKTTLRGGFRVAFADGQPFGTVPFVQPGKHHHRLMSTRSGQEIGSIICLSDVPSPNGPPIRYSVVAQVAAAEEAHGHTFLLASAVTFALADLRLKWALSNEK